MLKYAIDNRVLLPVKALITIIVKTTHFMYLQIGSFISIKKTPMSRKIIGEMYFFS